MKIQSEVQCEFSWISSSYLASYWNFPWGSRTEQRDQECEQDGTCLLSSGILPARTDSVFTAPDWAAPLLRAGLRPQSPISCFIRVLIICPPNYTTTDFKAKLICVIARDDQHKPHRMLNKSPNTTWSTSHTNLSMRWKIVLYVTQSSSLSWL